MDLPKGYYDWLLKKIRSGKIELDNHIHIFEIDGIHMIMRNDLLPLGHDMILEELRVL